MDNSYIAGFIDGEGWIGIAKSNGMMAGGKPRYFPECRITNTALDILEELKEKYGKGAHLREMKKNVGRRKIYQLKFYGSALINLLKDIRKYLRVKGAQADIVLATIETMTSGRRKLTKEILEERERLYVCCRKLNTFGYVPTEANLPILEARG